MPRLNPTQSPAAAFDAFPDGPPGRPWRFLSLRWRAALPLFLVTLAATMAGAYLLTRTLAHNEHIRAQNDLLRTSRAIADRMAPLAEKHRTEVTRIAFTEGIASGVEKGDAETLLALVEPLAAAAYLDVVVIADAAGQELVGLQRVKTAQGTTEYAVATGTDLNGLLLYLAPVGPASGGSLATRSTLARTSRDHTLVTAGPVPSPNSDQALGTILVGTHLPRVLDSLRGSDLIELALFGTSESLLRTTFALDDQLLRALMMEDTTFTQALTTPGAVPIHSLTLSDRPHNVAYLPFVLEGASPDQALGVLAVYQPDDTLVATAPQRNLLASIAALLAGSIVLGGFTVAGRFARRIEHITATARALANGDIHARTQLEATDEIGELGVVLDLLASRFARRNDALQATLRRYRAEAARLFAVLESVPDGLVVQDLDGRVLLINQAARELLGGQRAFRSARLHELTAVVTDTLGPALAPGLYALGDPTQIPLGDRVLQAQAAAITVNARTSSEQRIGTVIVLRDITADVIREQTREKLLDNLSAHAVVPSPSQVGDSLSALAREMVRNTRELQGVIAELRDLSTFEPRDLHVGQRPLVLNNLLWNIAAEWQPLAQAARMRLQVRFGPRDQYVLGDDRRLRWAIGNVLDNALKYAPPGALVRLSARIKADAQGQPLTQTAEIVVRDTGYGIAPDDLQHIFTRFYRGTPVDADGEPIRKPGTGQGLYIARRVIEAHGGRIAISSQVGTGTAVIVALPLTAPVILDISSTEREPGESAPSFDRLPPIDDEIELSQGWFDTVPLEPIKPREK